MKSIDIASKIAFIRCKHTPSGIEACVPCVKRIERSIDDTGIQTVIAAAKFEEPSTKLDKITPLTWCGAYDIVKLILRTREAESAVSR